MEFRDLKLLFFGMLLVLMPAFLHSTIYVHNTTNKVIRFRLRCFHSSNWPGGANAESWGDLYPKGALLPDGNKSSGYLSWHCGGSDVAIEFPENSVYNKTIFNTDFILTDNKAVCEEYEPGSAFAHTGKLSCKKYQKYKSQQFKDDGDTNVYLNENDFTISQGSKPWYRI